MQTIRNQFAYALKDFQVQDVKYPQNKEILTNIVVVPLNKYHYIASLLSVVSETRHGILWVYLCGCNIYFRTTQFNYVIISGSQLSIYKLTRVIH